MATIRISGDGIAGLTWALRLSMRRHVVHVVPGASRALPPEVFTLPAPYRDLFLKTGEELESVIELRPARNVTPIDRSTPLLRLAADMWTSVRSGSIPEGGSLLALARRTGADPQERSRVFAYAERAGLQPRSAPAALAVLPYLDATFGTWEFAGGLAAITAVLRDRCSSRGVQYGEPTTVDHALDEREVLTPYLGLVTPVPNFLRRSSAVGDPFALGLPFIGMGADAMRITA